MSECPPTKTEAELEADVDYMLDTIMADIKSSKLMTSDDVKQRVTEILKKRGMWKGGARRSRKRRSRRSKSSRNKRSTRRRRR